MILKKERLLENFTRTHNDEENHSKIRNRTNKHDRHVRPTMANDNLFPIARFEEIDVKLRPSPRGNHACVLLNDGVYLFGGEDNSENLLDDFWFGHFTLLADQS